MKLLIIEDEEVLFRVLQEKFEKEGVQIQNVDDGAKAMDVIGSFKPDLILLDIVLPNKDGFQILAEVKSSPKFKNIPVVIMSNLEEDEKIKTALRYGVLDYIVKAQHPIDELVEKVMRHSLKAK